MTIKPMPESQKAWVDGLQAESDKQLLFSKRNPDTKDGWTGWYPIDSIGEPEARSVLRNEVVFDDDAPEWKDVYDRSSRIWKVLKERKIPATLWATGGKGIHIHVFLKLPDDVDFDAARLLFWNDILDAANVPKADRKSGDGGLDIAKVKFTTKDPAKKGTLIRLEGAAKRDEKCKIIGKKVRLDACPETKPDTLKLPINYPSKITFYTPPAEFLGRLKVQSSTTVSMSDPVIVGPEQPWEKEILQCAAIRKYLDDPNPTKSDRFKYALMMKNGHTLVDKPVDEKISFTIRNAKWDSITKDNGLRTKLNLITLHNDPGKLTKPNQGRNYESICMDCKLKCPIYAHSINEKDTAAARLERLENGRKGAASGGGSADEVAAFKIRYELMDAWKSTKNGDQRREIKAHAANQVISYLLTNHRFITSITQNKEYIYHYENGVYTANGRLAIQKFVQQAFWGLCNRNLVSEIAGHILRTDPIPYEEIVDCDDPNLICVQNGIFNLKTNELQPHSPDYVFFNKLPVAYVPDAKCPNIERFLSEILPPEEVEYILELFGYCMYRGYPIPLIAIWIGEGANGKTVLANLFSAFLGKRNVKAFSLESLSTSDFLPVYLHGALANINPDIGSKPIYENEKIKSMSGGDLLTLNKKFADPVDFENYAKLIFGTNTPPIITDLGSAMLRRLRDTYFNVKFYSKSELALHKDEKNARLKDVHIIDKLTAKEELEGLFVLAVAALRNLLTRGEFANHKTEQEVKRSYLSQTQTFGAFCMDFLRVGGWEDYILKDDIRDAYRYWAQFNDIPGGKVASETAISQWLSGDLGARIGKKRFDEIFCPVYFGIKWDIEGIKEFSKDINPETPIPKGASVPGVPGVPTFFPSYLSYLTRFSNAYKKEKNPAQSAQSAHPLIDEKDAATVQIYTRDELKKLLEDTKQDSLHRDQVVTFLSETHSIDKDIIRIQVDKALYDGDIYEPKKDYLGVQQK
jgi:P4 family phage/plasmid primase-like protien